jgi:hypothetical protein
MKKWQKYCAGLAATAGIIPNATAQSFPGVPSPPAPPAIPGAAGAAAPAGAPADAKTIWSMLGLSKDQKKKCKEQLCQSQLGLLLSNTLAPVTMFSGGLLPTCCPGTPSAAELAAGGAVGAAAAVKKDAAEAKARIAAVKYLAGISCHYWPDAEKALIDAMRADKVECVRYEAAVALGSGCCCTKKVIDKLALVISGGDSDGNPAEISDRVKDAAERSLNHCLECYKEIVPAPKVEKPPEAPKPVADKTPPPPVISDPNLRRTAYDAQIEKASLTDVVQHARVVLESATKAPPKTSFVPAGQRDLMHLVSTAAINPRGPSTVDLPSGVILPPDDNRVQVASILNLPPEPEATDLVSLLTRKKTPTAPTSMVGESIAVKRDAIGHETVVRISHGTDLSTAAVESNGDKGLIKTTGGSSLLPDRKDSPGTGPKVDATIGQEKPVAGATGTSKPGVVPGATNKASSATGFHSQEPAPANSSSATKVLPSTSRTLTYNFRPPSTTSTPPAQSPTGPGYNTLGAPPNLVPPTIRSGSIYNTLTPIPAAASPSGGVVPATTSFRPLDTAPAAAPRQQTIVPASYTTGAAAGTAAPTTVPPASSQAQPKAAGLITVLNNSSDPIQREWAAEMLATVEWPADGQVVSALVAAAQHDSWPRVRIQCLRCLSSRNVRSFQVVAALKLLQSDSDPSVRQEAATTLNRMGASH